MNERHQERKDSNFPSRATPRGPARLTISPSPARHPHRHRHPHPSPLTAIIDHQPARPASYYNDN
jgi:hypothetical protein